MAIRLTSWNLSVFRKKTSHLGADQYPLIKSELANKNMSFHKRGHKRNISQWATTKGLSQDLLYVSFCKVS